MSIEPSKTSVPTPPPARRDPPARPHERDDSGRESVGQELLDLITKGHGEGADGVAGAAKEAGRSLKQVWSALRGTVTKVLKMPVVQDTLPEHTRLTLLDIAKSGAFGVGCAATGVLGLAAAVRLASGVHKHNTQKSLDGLTELAAATTMGAAVVGLGALRLAAAPAAAGLGVVRGSYNAAQGIKKRQLRVEIQGLLDGTRSLATVFRLAGALVPPLGIVGAVLAPVAGLLQAGRGYHDLRSGLVEGVNRKEFNGLTDLGLAVGTTLALTGVGTIPGVALTVACSALRVGYQLSKKVRKRIDGVLDKMEPKLRLSVTRIDRAARPVARRLLPKGKGNQVQLLNYLVPGGNLNVGRSNDPGLDPPGSGALALEP